MARSAGTRADPGFSLKDDLFNAGTVATLASALAEAHPPFQRRQFERAALDRFPALELKARIHWLVACLTEQLPPDFTAATDILLAALPPPLDPSRSDNDFGRFIWVVPGEYVAAHGCTAQHLERALALLEATTQRFSAEFALRPFLARFPDATMAAVHRWTSHRHYHVRRLASEGIRPFLPWGLRVQLPVPAVLAVLDPLHADATRYVTRSVANTLNDLSKVDPEAVLGQLASWQQAGRQAPEELAWLTRHALRTLLKQDHPGALAFQGYAARPAFRLTGVDVPAQVPVGGSLDWHGTLHSLAGQRLRVALRVHYRKANGSLSPRVFALQDRSFAAGEQVVLGKRQSFRPMTTRSLHTGSHAVELVVNGVARGRRSFEVVPA